MPQHMSCSYWGLNDFFPYIPLLTMKQTLLLGTPQQKLPVLLNRPDNPQNCPIPLGNLDCRLIHGSLDPPESAPQTASRLVQPFLQGSRTWPTDRHTDRRTHTHTDTDRPRYCVCSNGPHLMQCMWCGLILIKCILIIFINRKYTIGNNQIEKIEKKT